MPAATRSSRRSCSTSHAPTRPPRASPTASAAPWNSGASPSAPTPSLPTSEIRGRSPNSSDAQLSELGLRPRISGVELGAFLHELDGLLLHPLLDVVTHVLRDLHRAEV